MPAARFRSRPLRVISHFGVWQGVALVLEYRFARFAQLYDVCFPRGGEWRRTRAPRPVVGKGLEMAVPKRKTGRAKTNSRKSANLAMSEPARSVCPQCGEVKLPHRVCGNCGYYRNREVLEVE